MTGEVLVLGTAAPVGPAVIARLRETGASVVEAAGFGAAEVSRALEGRDALAALVVLIPPPDLSRPFREIEDAEIEAALARFLALIAALQAALPLVQAGGHLLGVGWRGHLGGWGGAHERAFDGALVGLFRSLALETAERGLKVNLVALDLPGAGAPLPPAEAADLVAHLMAPAFVPVSGGLILADAGRSLKMREARDRRSPRAAASPIAPEPHP